MNVYVCECWKGACSECQHEDEIIWTCKNEQDVVVGKMVCVKESKHILHLTMIETDPGKGIGKTLLQSLTTYCEMNDISHVYLYPHPDVIGFFTKMGFHSTIGFCDAVFQKHIRDLHDPELLSRILYKRIQSKN